MKFLGHAALIGLIVASTLLSSCNRPAPGQPSRVWHVDPADGDDSHSGNSEAQAWKTFAPLTKITLGPGDVVEISPGRHEHSLVPMAQGDIKSPVIIRFLPGLHEFDVEQATRRAYFVSNSCATPETPMPIGILIKDCRHLLITGSGTRGPSRTTLMMSGRMTHFINDHSQSIEYRDLVFDLKRPTVSEFRVIGRGDDWADIQIAEASTYRFDNGAFEWTGDIGSGQPLLQQAIPAEGRAWRTRFTNNPIDLASRIESLGNDRFRLHFENRPPPESGHQFQFRLGDRTVVGAHNNRCRDIRLTDVEFNAFAGMGIISQFTENLSFERVMVVPPANTLRTCPAWADVFHFSGCRGQILIDSCVVSGTQDDMVNVHGTYLRIIEQRGDKQVLLRFMHPQTYGFAAFQPGDEIAVVHGPTLREHPDNPRRKVTAIERINDHDWLLTLDGAVPHHVENDVIDNLSWNPEVIVRNCRVDMNSCRGLLLSSSGRTVVDSNTFHRCRMAAILVAADASKWFESGPVRDIVIRDNTFIACGFEGDPSVRTGNEAVHENIRIIDNHFKEGAGIHAHHCAELVITGNRSDNGELRIQLDPQSTRAEISNNR